MAKKYSPKKVELVYEQVEAPTEDTQQRINNAFDILFEETLRLMQIEKNSQAANQDQLLNYQGSRRGGEKQWAKFLQ